MPTIEFHYAGAINNDDVQGEAELVSNPDDGKFNARINFAQMSSSVPLLAWGVSLLSVSCSNGGKQQMGAQNILSTTSGPYQSIRTISLVDMSTRAPVGLLRIAGRFADDSGDKISADVHLSGSYNGPTDIDTSKFQGYSLPTIPVNGMDVPALYGVTHISLKHGSGMLVAKHEQLYLFEAGITQHLQPNIMRVSFTHIDGRDYPRATEVEGISELFPLPDSSPVSWFYRP